MGWGHPWHPQPPNDTQIQKLHSLNFFFTSFFCFQCCQIIFSEFRQIFRHIAPPRNWWFLATFTPQKSYFGHTLSTFLAKFFLMKKIFCEIQPVLTKYSHIWHITPPISQIPPPFGGGSHFGLKISHILVAGSHQFLPATRGPKGATWRKKSHIWQHCWSSWGRFQQVSLAYNKSRRVVEWQ